MRYVLALGLIIVGFILVVGTESVLRMFGSMNFAENFFKSSGGSRSIYKLIGVGIIFLGFIIMFNMHQSALRWIAENLFGAYVPKEGLPTNEFYEIR